MKNPFKEYIRSSLEFKLQDYVRKQCGVYCNIVVECSSNESKDDKSDFTIIVIYYPNSCNPELICKSIYDHVLNFDMSMNREFNIEYMTYLEYYMRDFNNILVKTTFIPNNLFDVNDRAFSSMDIIGNSDNKAFIYKDNILYLNTGYVEYSHKYQDLNRYSDRKLFPLFYMNFTNIDGKFWNIYNKINYINTDIDIEYLYSWIKLLKLEMLFFFTYLFHRINDKYIEYHDKDKSYICNSHIYDNEFKVNMLFDDKINDYKIELSYKEIDNNYRISLQLLFIEKSNEIKVIITYDNRIIFHKFLITSNILEYDIQIANIFDKITILQNLSNNKNIK